MRRHPQPAIIRMAARTKKPACKTRVSLARFSSIYWQRPASWWIKSALYGTHYEKNLLGSSNTKFLLLFRVFGVDQQGDGAIIDQCHFHVCPKRASCHRFTQLLFKLCDEAFEHRLRNLAWRCTAP